MSEYGGVGIGASGGVIQIPGTRSEYNWRSRSFASSKLPRQQHATEEAMKLHRSVLMIEDWWIRTNNRRVFRVLKETICAAEHSLTQEVLRKVSPMEAELLKDPTIKAKIKFRFGGDTFPPVVLFKIFTSTSSQSTIGGVAGGGVQYISGKRLIKPASEAAEDSRRQMGNRKFYDQMLLDACHHHQLKVTEETDVTTMKEYMQYAANVDESPAYLGGKENTWRKLNLDALPRHSLLHDIIEFLEQDQADLGSPRLKGKISRSTASLERLKSLTRPPTQHEQIEHIKTVSSLRSLSSRHPHPAGRESQETLRRSRQAQKRVERMRKAYGFGQTPSPAAAGDHDHEVKGLSGRSTEMEGERVHNGVLAETNDEINEIEKEAFELYQWTQELSFEEIG